MRLFLASQDLGKFPEVLAKLVGEKKRALVISNTRDYYQDEERIQKSLEKTFVNLDKIGIKSKRLDLRKYFGKPEELTKDVETYNPGLIFSIGGNVFCLATAMHESGMDKIIRQGLANDNFVYGGYSAGAMVASEDLGLYNAADFHDKTCKMSDKVVQTYHIKPTFQGLSLIPQYILPHMDREDHIDSMKQRLENIKQANKATILLNDADVYIVNGAKQEILKGEK